jgi:putative ABC transport system permease protein
MSLAAPLIYIPRMSSVLAAANLIHDRTRLIVTLIGIVFAVVLMNVELGLFFGFATTTSALVDHAGADLWIMAAGTSNVDQAVAISERKLYQALATAGVARAARLNVEFAYFKKPDGGTETVLVVGFDPESGLGAPWNVVEGDVRDLRFPGTIMVDELYREKLGIRHLGQVVEISGRRAQVVGFTRGIRSFTQSPYVFASTQTALDYSRVRSDQTKYVLVDLTPGVDGNAVKADLARHIPDVEVRTADEFSRLTQIYWMFTTGAGLALLVGAALGLIVGIVVVSQTLYATTVDHIAEFGTLRAIGGSNRYIYGIIIRQALLSAVAGYVCGLAVTCGILYAARDAGPAILVPSWMMGGMFAVTLAMCASAAIISIARVTRVDPSAVFKR